MKILRNFSKKKEKINIGRKDEIAACSANAGLCDCSKGGLLSGADVRRALQGVSQSRVLATSDQGCILM